MIPVVLRHFYVLYERPNPFVILSQTQIYRQNRIKFVNPESIMALI